jgi:HD-like signal output (HDOD) protein
VYTGLLSRSIAKRVNVLHPERLFVAGLLHDIGSLVLYHYHPQTMRELLLVADEDEEVMYRAEHQTLGFNHASLAGGLLAEWQLPDTLQQAVAWHHEPMFSSLAYTEACILKTASQMANETEAGHFLGSGSTVDLEDAAPVCEGLQDVDIELIREEVAEQFESTLQSLL